MIKMEMETLARLVSEREDHLTIFKFTTHWKIMRGSPNLDTGKERENIRKLPEYNSLEAALFSILIDGGKKHG